MGISGSRQRTTSTTNQTTTPQVPNWIAQPYQNYMNNVQGLLNTPTAQQTSAVPAGPLQQQAWSLAGNLGQTNPNMTAASDATRGLLNYTPDSVSAGQLSETNLDPYMNPYQSQVIDSLLGDFSHANDLGLNSLRSMTPNGAYGGSRQMVAAGQLVGDNTRSLAGTLAGLRSQGYQNAQNAAMFDIGNRYNADTFNSQQGLVGANFRLGAANQLGAQAGQESATRMAEMGLLGDLGAQQREVATENDPTQARLRYLAQLGALLGMTPSATFTGQNTSGTSTSTTTGGSNGLLGGLGTLLQGAGAIGLRLPSDRRLKTDITFSHTDAKGLRWYEYRYIWDEPGVKRSGVMADEAPAHAVIRHPAGFDMVDYGAL